MCPWLDRTSLQKCWFWGASQSGWMRQVGNVKGGLCPKKGLGVTLTYPLLLGASFHPTWSVLLPPVWGLFSRETGLATKGTGNFSFSGMNTPHLPLAEPVFALLIPLLTTDFNNEANKQPLCWLRFLYNNCSFLDFIPSNMSGLHSSYYVSSSVFFLHFDPIKSFVTPSSESNLH